MANAPTVVPDTPGNGTRIEAVMADVRDGIARRRLLPGARLPSVRAAARAMGLSVSTVVEGYERLVAEGVITARPGSGFYVAGRPAPLSLETVGPRIDRAIDPLWISRQSLEARPGALIPGCGWLPADWMHEAGLKRGLRQLARASGGDLTDYASPQGHAPLRQILSKRLGAVGIEAAPAEILLAESGTQAIDLVCRFLLSPGDKVLVDDPCYFNFQALLKAHRADVIGVPYTPNGPDVAAFENALSTHKPRLYITNSAIHNPTGAVLSPVTAHRILKLAEAAGLIIIEDDIFADFEVVPAPRLAAFDGLQRVVHVGSFSKTLSASVRCGYIAARPDWIADLADLKIATSFGGGRMAAELLHTALTDGGYRRHMETIRQRLQGAMERTAETLAALGLTPWLRPAAGMFLWCRLPGEIDAAAVARACLADNIVLAPGNAFSPSQTAGSFLRFNAAQSLDRRIFTSLARAIETAGKDLTS